MIGSERGTIANDAIKTKWQASSNSDRTRLGDTNRVKSGKIGGENFADSKIEQNDGGGDQRNGCIKNRDQNLCPIEKEVVSDPRMPQPGPEKPPAGPRLSACAEKPSGRRVDGEGHRGVQLRWGIPALPIEALQCFENKKLMSASHLALPFLGIITAVSAPQGHVRNWFSPSKGAAGRFR